MLEPAPMYATTVGDTVTVETDAPIPARPPVTPLVVASASGLSFASILIEPETSTVVLPPMCASRLEVTELVAPLSVSANRPPATACEREEALSPASAVISRLPAP